MYVRDNDIFPGCHQNPFFTWRFLLSNTTHWFYWKGVPWVFVKLSISRCNVMFPVLEPHHRMLWYRRYQIPINSMLVWTGLIPLLDWLLVVCGNVSGGLFTGTLVRWSIMWNWLQGRMEFDLLGSVKAVAGLYHNKYTLMADILSS